MGALSFASLQRLRLGAGLVLFVFVTTHLLNHALGNISLDAMEWGRKGFLALWRNPVGTILLYGALIVHAALVAWALARRRTLRMPAREAVQLAFGFSLPLLLATHVVANRGAHEVFGKDDTYAYVVLSIWVWDWKQGVLQTVALLVAWTHGCLGLYHWLRLKPLFQRWRQPLFAAALLLPAFALAGFAGAGKEAALLARDPLWTQHQMARVGGFTQAEVAWVYATADGVRWGAFAALLGLLALRWGRLALERRRGRFSVSYPDGRRVAVERGYSVLEASRVGGVPHASVCGGRGRCSTCRVRVVAGFESLPLAAPEESRVLERIHAGANVRLACQLRPTKDLAVVPLLPAAAGMREAHRAEYAHGGEREIAILFADLRAFTRFSEGKLPYDVVFVVNQYFRAMGAAVERSGGRLDKFIGDGVMALFGVEGGMQEGCRDALAAARAMAEALAEMNDHLKHDLPEPLRMGIGIHAGPAIVGEMGYRQAVSLTAMGDAVNTASRLESATKDFSCQLVASAAVADASGLDFSAYERRQIEVRGRAEGLDVVVVPDARTLPAPAPRRGRQLLMRSS